MDDVRREVADVRREVADVRREVSDLRRMSNDRFDARREAPRTGVWQHREVLEREPVRTTGLAGPNAVDDAPLDANAEVVATSTLLGIRRPGGASRAREPRDRG